MSPTIYLQSSSSGLKKSQYHEMQDSLKSLKIDDYGEKFYSKRITNEKNRLLMAETPHSKIGKYQSLILKR